MQRNLILDVLIVLGVWFVILYLFSGAQITDFGLYASGIPVIWVVGWLAGGVVGTNAKLVRWYRSRKLERAPNPHVKATIMARMPPTPEFVAVEIPVATQPKRDYNYLTKQSMFGRSGKLRAAGKLTIKPKDVVENWSTYQEEHPEYARAIVAVLQVMASEPSLKASPYDGHGNLTIYEHSINVVKAMREVAPTWQFRGVFDSKGRVVIPLQDASSVFHSFDPKDPILPLVALAHDIGKLECYKIGEAGQIKEVKKDHGSVGAQMLRRIPEIMDLPMGERDAIILAVEFYHHMSDILVSKWVGDRTRSLTGLLYQADCLASIREGDKDPEKIQARNEYVEQLKKDQPSSTQANATAPPQKTDEGRVDEVAAQDLPTGDDPLLDAQTSAMDEPGAIGQDPLAQANPVSPGYDPLAMLESMGSDSPETADSDERTSPPRSIQAGPSDISGSDEDGEDSETTQARFIKAANDPPVWSSKDGLDPVEMLVEVLREPSRINGKDRNARIAWKQGKFLYIYEQFMRQAVSARFDEPAIAENRTDGNSYTKEVMRRLQANGELVDTFGQMVFTYKRALWRVDMGNTTGSVSRKNANPVMLIASAKALGFDHLEDGPRTPVIDSPFWGKSAASGKKKNTDLESIEREDLTQANFLRWILARPDDDRAVRKTHLGQPHWLIKEEDAQKIFNFDIENLPSRVDEENHSKESDEPFVPAPVGKVFGSKSQSWFLSIMEKL